MILWACCVVLALTSCKKSGDEACKKACAHATEVVLDMVAAKGALNSQALTERSTEMQLSCQAECKEGGVEPQCLINATSFEALQECSSEAPEPEKTQKEPAASQAPAPAVAADAKNEKKASADGKSDPKAPVEPNEKPLEEPGSQQAP